MKSLLRQPYSVLGALGMLGLAGDLIRWQEQIGEWIAAWRSFSGLVANLLFGWAIGWAHPPAWVYDYLALGIIVAAAFVRAIAATTPVKRISWWMYVKAAIGVVVLAPLWPAWAAYFVSVALIPSIRAKLTAAGVLATRVFLKHWFGQQASLQSTQRC